MRILPAIFDYRSVQISIGTDVIRVNPPRRLHRKERILDWVVNRRCDVLCCGRMVKVARRVGDNRLVMHQWVGSLVQMVGVVHFGTSGVRRSRNQ